MRKKPFAGLTSDLFMFESGGIAGKTTALNSPNGYLLIYQTKNNALSQHLLKQG